MKMPKLKDLYRYPTVYKPEMEIGIEIEIAAQFAVRVVGRLERQDASG